MNLWDPEPASHNPVSSALLDAAPTLTAALETLVTRHGDLQCLVFLDRNGTAERLTIADVWTRARAVQAELIARALRPGNLVLIVLPTGPDLLAAYFGAVLAGGVPGLLAPPSNRFGSHEVYARYLSTLARHAEAHTICTHAEVAALLGASATPGSVITPADVPPTAAPPPIVAASADTICTVQYSSGTTGAAKGVLISHGAILANVRATRDAFGLRPDDVAVNWIPLYHDMGLMYAFLMPVLSGVPTVLFPTMTFMRDPAIWLRAMHRFRGTISFAPNFAYALAATRLADGALAGLDLSRWRIAFSGSEPVLASTFEAFTRRFASYGLPRNAPTAGWGLAEIVGMATISPVGEPLRVERLDRRALTTEGIARSTTRDGMEVVAVGRPIAGVEIEIRDDARQALPERQVGTVWLRSTFLFSRYHREPEGTAAALIDGWLDTGDRGYLAGGQLFFVSRSKDLVVIGGEKYAPHDLETIINEVPGVRQGCVAVFGVLNQSQGTEEVATVVETHVEDPTTRDTLVSAIRQALAHATGLGIRHVLLVAPGGIEKTTSGKIARDATRRRWAAALGEPDGG